MNKIFKKNSKSFSFASKFFPPKISKEIENIYPFFRFSDDFSDDPIDNSDFEATIKFGKKINKFKNTKDAKKWLKKSFDDPIIQQAYLNYLNYGLKYQVPTKYMHLIFRGYQIDKRMDLSKTHQITSLYNLIRYCIYVASSVSVVLAYTIQDEYPIDKKTLSQFAAIGIGFQLTNFARDIITDAKMKRCYIPWMTTSDKKKLFAGKLDNSIILRYSKELVELADAYYCYGVPILNKIPAKVGNGLKICTRIYREIGLKIYSMDYYPKRCYTTKFEKLWLLWINTQDKPFLGNGIMPYHPSIFL